MDIELKNKWIAALRSGEYSQGEGQLKSGCNYCCLGVLLDQVDHDAWEVNSWKIKDGLDDEHYAYTSIPNNIRIKYDIDLANVIKLIKMNDTDGKNFSDIADYIEEML